MMTLIVVLAFLLIAFIGLLRYDIHKHKHRSDRKPLAGKGDDTPNEP